jgi:hypothetical protein
MDLHFVSSSSHPPPPIDSLVSQCGTLCLRTNLPCKVSIIAGPCRFHGEEAVASRVRAKPPRMPGLSSHVSCCCSREVKASILQTNPPSIYRNGISSDLLPPLFVNLLKCDLPHKNDSDFNQYMQATFEERRGLWSITNYSYTHLDFKLSINIKTLRLICQSVGSPVPSKISLKKDIVHYTLRLYEKELLFRSSPTFEEASYKNWNVHSAAQVLKVRWRKYSLLLLKLYGTPVFK